MTAFQDVSADADEDYQDDPLLQIFPEDLADESGPPASSGEEPPPASGSAANPTPDSDPVTPLRKLPDDLFLARQAKVALFRVLEIAADSRTVFNDDLTVIWNQITLPGDPPAVLMLANMAKQIITIRKMLATESPSQAPKRPIPTKQSSMAQPKLRKLAKAEAPTHHVPV